MGIIDCTVAVTGLNATDNPGPGVSVIRSLRHDHDFKGRVVGLYYGAKLARSLDEAIAAYHRIVAEWGVPVIIQQAIKLCP